jgi:hypothetical protein
MSPETYSTTAPLGLAVAKFSAVLPVSLIEVAEKLPGPVTVVVPLIAPSAVGAGLVGIVAIGSEMFAFAVQVPEVTGALVMLVALVPMFAAHEFTSLQLVGSVHAPAGYAPLPLSQLSIAPSASKLEFANAALLNPGIGQLVAASTCAVAALMTSVAVTRRQRRTVMKTILRQ